MRHFSIAALLLVLPLAGRATDQWPMYLGSVDHASYNSGQTQLNAQNVAQLKQLWKINVGTVISTGVTVNGGRLYFGDWNGYFYSVDASTGSIVWKTFVGKSPDPADPTCQRGTGVTGQSVVSGNSVYLPGGDSAIYALDAASGGVQWKTPLADPAGGSQLWSSVMLSGNALYVGISSLGDCPVVQGGVARIDLANPTQAVIQYLVPATSDGGAGVWSTPAVDEKANLVYVSTGNADYQDATQGYYGSAIVALDATTLEIKGSFFMPIRPADADMDFGSSTSLFQTPDGKQYVAANGKDGVMYVLNRPDLSLAWSYKLATGCVSPEQGCGSISTPAFDGRNVFVGAGQTDAAYNAPGSVYALDPVTHSPLWVYNAAAMVLAPVTLTPGLVFVPTAQGLVALDATSGAELWKDPQAQGQYAQAAVTNGLAYATYINGDVVAWGLATAGSAPIINVPPVFATPTELTFRYTSGGRKPAAQTLSVVASSGDASFTVASDSAWLSAGAASGAAPATLAVTADVSNLAPGIYSGRLTLTPTGGPAVVVPVKTVVGAALPSLPAAAITNAASFVFGALAPGGLFSIFATNLSPETAAASTVPFPTVFNGVSVKFNGIAAPLSYVSSTQINGQIPYEIQPGTASVVVEANGAATQPVSVTVSSAAPGIFLQADTKRAAALNQDYSLNSASNPAPGGSVISVYFTGQGQVDDVIITGAAAPYEYFCDTAAQTTATIGGQAAAVQFSGLAPRYVGLAQANLTVPSLTPGDYEVVLTVGNAQSNAGTISVK